MEDSQMLNELVEKCRPLFDKANKRIKRLEESGVHSPVLEAVLKEGTFSIRGKSLNELEREYRRVKMFLYMGTSTVNGAKKYVSSAYGSSDMSLAETREYLERNQED